MFLLLLLFCDDDDADFAIVTDEEEDDNFAVVVVFNVVLLTLPLLDGSPFCVNRAFSVVIWVMLMVVTDNMLMFSCLFMRACVCFVFCCAVKFVFSVVLAISSGPSRPPIFSLVKKLKNEGKKQLLEEKIRRERETTHF